MIEDYKLKPAEINIPWQGSEPQGEMRENACRKISETASSDLTDLQSKILIWQPEDRLSLVDIKNHPWLTGVESKCETSVE